MNDKKIRILHVIGTLKVGGAENVAMNFLRYIDRNKFQCDYLVFGEEIGEYEKEAIKLGANIIHIDDPKYGYKRYIKNLKKIFMKEKYDVVHAHLMFNNGIILKAAYDTGIKKRISHSHSTSSGKNEGIIYKIYSSNMRRMILKYATDIVGCGTDAGRYLYGKDIFDSSGVIINNGIDINKYKYDENIQNKIKKELGLTNNLVIGHVGRFVDTKNHEFLIDIFYEISKIREDVRLLLIGDGELRKEVESKIKRLKIEDKVIMMGVRMDIEIVQQAIDVFVFPSKYEGFPVTIVEAQAASIPCIVSDSVTDKVKITDLVEFLSLEDSIENWSKKIMNKMMSKKIDKSNEMIKSGFDIKTLIKKMESIYESK